MRSYRLTAAVATSLVLAGCSSNNGPSNQNPTANFAVPTCNLLNCAFTDASTDADGTIASRAWTFQSGTPATSTAANPTVDFPAAGTYTASLTVTDNDGGTGTFSRDVIVTGAAANTNPTANFTFSCTGLDCTFTDASSDPDAGDAVASWAWDFGDGATSTQQNPSHSYTVGNPTTEQVTLTVTDNNGGTGTVTKGVPVTPGGLTCGNGSSSSVSCPLTLTQNSTVTITLTTRDCNANGNTLRITSPITQTIFTNGCSETQGTVYQVNGGTAFNAGTDLVAEVTSGSTDPNRIPPAVSITGSFPDWTLNFDDGEDPTGPGEPDFNDLVLTVHATVVP